MTNKDLSIEDYNSHEIDGKIGLSNRFIRAFRPKLFENGGFPITVIKEEELIRYIDSMHAYSLEKHFNELCGGITKEEFELLKKCTKDIYEVTKNYYNGNFLVKAPMIASICEKRIIESALGTTDEKRIFEIGGGAGTLGSLLLEDNINYAATDVTQAFYLIQNRLYNYITDFKMNELATENLSESAPCIHVPYWKLWDLKDHPFNIDLVVSNHALLEMSPNSLRFYLNFCRKAMENSKDGLFVFQGGGWRIEQNLIDLIALFDEYEYNLKYFDHSKEIAVFSLSKGNVTKEVLYELKKLLEQEIENEKIYALGNHIRTRLDKDKIFFCDDLGERMDIAFKEKQQDSKISFNELLEFYAQFENIKESPDDEFGNYILSKRKV